MKKPIIATAAAMALLAGPLLSHKANAEELQPNPKQKLVTYEVKHTTNIQEIEKWIQQALNNYKLNITMNQSNIAKQPVQKAETQPTQKQANDQAPTNNSNNTSNQTTYQLSAYEKQVVDLTNQERQKNGLPALKINTTLSKMAHTKSNDMESKHYFDHTSPTYGSPFEMMKKFGITYQTAGENIAMGQQTPQEVVKSWMNSEGHRANILNKNYTEIGVGYIENGHYWTQEFIGK